MIGVVWSVGLVGWLVGFLLMVMVNGRVELVFLLGTAHHGCRFMSVLSWLVAGWLVSLSAFALAGVRVQVGRE